MQTREFHQVSRTGKTRVWTIEVVGSEIRTSYGELGGKMQSVVDVGVRKNVGKVNEISAEDDALYLAGRAILEKTRNGYCEEGSERATRIDWNSTLPVNLRFYKPDNTLSTTLEKKAESNRALFGRKRDGECLVVVKGPDGKVDVYSRRMLRSHHLEIGVHEWKERLPHLVGELEADDRVPPCSILLGDVVNSPKDDGRWAVATFMKSLTPDAISKCTPPFFYCWDIPFLGGVPVCTEATIGERYQMIWGLFGRSWRDDSFVVPIETWSLYEIVEAASAIHIQNRSKSGTECAKIVSKQKGWEGWVVVDPDGEYGDKAFNFRGKTDRPGKFCGKLKPVLEADMLAFWDPDNTLGHGAHGKYGTGNSRGMVGSFSLYQYNTRGDLVYICECGSGLSDEFRAQYSKPWTEPLVVEVEFTERTFISNGDKTNALTFPRLSRVRHDKAPRECEDTEL